MPLLPAVVLSLLTIAPASDPKAELNEQLFTAARKGDAALVRSLLDKGADVNATWRYGLTPLMHAASRGHVEVVRALLDKGARVDVKDTFYGMTPIVAAAQSGSAELVRLLLEKGASEGAEFALQQAVQNDNAELAKVVLERAKLKPDTLSTALGRAIAGKKTAVADALRQAGAAEPPKAEFAVPAETLAKYAGKYKGEQGELSFELKDGRLVGGPPGQTLVLGAFDERRFRPGDMFGTTITFEVEGGRATGVSVERPGGVQKFKRVE
jgi:hypothetical protein